MSVCYVDSEAEYERKVEAERARLNGEMGALYETWKRLGMPDAHDVARARAVLAFVERKERLVEDVRALGIPLKGMFL